MREVKLREFWQPFSVLISLTYNVNRGKNKKAVKAEDLNPYLRKEEARSLEVVRDNKMFMDALKAMFIKEKK